MGDWGVAPYKPKIPPPTWNNPSSSKLPHQIFIFLPHQTRVFKNFIFSCRHCSCTIFVLTLYSLYARFMLILVLMDIQYLQNIGFSFKKSLSDQNHSSSNSYHMTKISSIKSFHVVKDSLVLVICQIWSILT